MTRALAAEFLKLKRAKAPMWTALVVFVYTAIATVMLTGLREPSASARLAKAGGAFSKAAAAGLYEATWANFLRGIPQGIAGAWGVLVFGFVTAYLFAHEFKEGTAAAMLTAPIRREYFIVAKFVVLAVWILGLTLLSAVLMAGGIALVGLDGFAWAHVLGAVTDSLKVSALLFLTLPFIAWLAVRGRGYLQPMLVSIALVMAGNGLISTGLARWFPWDMPVLVAGASWMPIPPMSLVPGSWAVAVGVFAAGLVMLSLRIDRADVAA